jgi:hypothetical protein
MFLIGRHYIARGTIIMAKELNLCRDNTTEKMKAKGNILVLSRLMFSMLFCVLVSYSIEAQEQRFNAGIIAGLTASQVLGDDIAGYNKVGIQAGLRGTTYLSEKVEFNLELLYSQHGSRRKAIGATGIERSIQLNYIKVPLLIHYKDWYQDDDYYRVHFVAGLYYGYLINAEVQEFSFDPDDFNTNEIGFIVGANYFLNSHVGLAARYERSFTRLWSSETNPDFKKLVPYNLSFQFIYLF